jgi:hypothetical protein
MIKEQIILSTEPNIVQVQNQQVSHHLLPHDLIMRHLTSDEYYEFEDMPKVQRSFPSSSQIGNTDFSNLMNMYKVVLQYF